MTGDPGERLEILTTTGTLTPGSTAPLSIEETLDALRWMLLSSAIDARLVSLQRQGRMGTFSAVRGQEASVVGSACAIDPARDWMVPSYREMPATLRHGVPLPSLISYWKGNPVGARIPDGVRVLPVQIALAAQLPHAVGLAWGLRLRAEDGVVLAYFGDGSSSEGDFHEALNLAGVVRAPVVFFLQNNGWAISTPRSRQTAAASFAARAAGYGMPGVVVDGNDLFAVHHATSEAAARARRGEGPTLIESQTFRMGAHNTADDPTRYRSAEEAANWDERDPILRLTRYLRSAGAWDDELEQKLRAELDAEVTAAIDAVERLDPPNREHLFTEVYAKPPARMLTQQRVGRTAVGGTE